MAFSFHLAEGAGHSAKLLSRYLADPTQIYKKFGNLPTVKEGKSSHVTNVGYPPTTVPKGK